MSQKGAPRGERGAAHSAGRRGGQRPVAGAREARWRLTSSVYTAGLTAALGERELELNADKAKGISLSILLDRRPN